MAVPTNITSDKLNIAILSGGLWVYLLRYCIITANFQSTIITNKVIVHIHNCVVFERFRAFFRFKRNYYYYVKKICFPSRFNSVKNGPPLVDHRCTNYNSCGSYLLVEARRHRTGEEEAKVGRTTPEDFGQLPRLGGRTRELQTQGGEV